MNRREFFRNTAGATGAALAVAAAPDASAEPARFQGGASPWPLTLNASTIRPAPVLDKVSAAAAAGWDGLELWIGDFEEHEQKNGKSLKDLAKLVTDQGLYIPNVIGLWDCLPPTQEEWEKSLPMTRDRMRMCSEAGARSVAMLPFPDRENFDLKWAADRYRDLMKIGRDDYGIKVAFEYIGFLKGVHRLGQAAAVALDADDPAACLIMDTFHLYRGGSGFNGVQLLQPSMIGDFHWNDVPATPPREQCGDADRIYPGDGILPLEQTMRDLKRIGYTGTLSLELFNRALWEQDPRQVAQDGKRKMLEQIARAGV